jgi:hypothetical protein
MHHVEDLKDVITVPSMKYAIAENNKPGKKNFISLMNANVLPDIWSVKDNATIPIHLLTQGVNVIIGIQLCYYTINRGDKVKYGFNAKLHTLYVVTPIKITEPTLDMFANPVAYLKRYGSSGKSLCH